MRSEIEFLEFDKDIFLSYNGLMLWLADLALAEDTSYEASKVYQLLRERLQSMRNETKV